MKDMVPIENSIRGPTLQSTVEIVYGVTDDGLDM